MNEQQILRELKELRDKQIAQKRDLDYLLDTIGAHHVWQWAEEENVDATHSMSRGLYLPTATAVRLVQRVYARVKLLALRDYNHATTAIVTGTSPAGCTIVINGTDRTNALTGGATFAADKDALDITPYIDLTLGYNTIELTSTQLGRFRLTVWCDLYVNEN